MTTEPFAYLRIYGGDDYMRNIWIVSLLALVVLQSPQPEHTKVSVLWFVVI